MALGVALKPVSVALSQTPAYMARAAYTASRGVSVYSPAGIKLYCLVTEAHRCK